MERLWAPWRMKYIERVDKQEGCFLCDAAALSGNDEERLVLVRTDLSLMIMNLFPYNNGHLLVAPLAHKGEPDDLEEEQMIDLIRLTGLARRAIERAYHPHGYNIGCNLGRAAGAGIPDHVHVHVIPRWDGDTNFMPVMSDVRVISEAMEDTYARLKTALENISEEAP